MMRIFQSKSHQGGIKWREGGGKIPLYFNQKDKRENKGMPPRRNDNNNTVWGEDRR